MKKQILLFVLALLPLVASADDSGSCGDGVTYIYKASTGTLTISKTGEGTGKMNNYTTTTKPWGSYYDKIKKVVIENGVTSIGNYAFYPCFYLAGVTIPNSVTSIGEYAFSYCDHALKSITIPISVTSIGEGAFFSCNSLISINIPNEITTIEANTFAFCNSLKSVNIPNSVKSIGKEAFRECSSITAITIPNAVTSIEDATFYGCSSLKSVTIPNSVTNIGSHAFSYSGLNSVIIPNCYIGDRAFYDCKALTSVIIRTSNVHPKYNSDFKYHNFEGCDNIKEIVFDCEIARALLRGITALEKVTLTDNVKSIEQGAFSGCINLASINIPSSVTNIGGEAFTSCGLTSIVVDSDNTYYDSRDNCNAIIETASNTLFTGCQTTIIPNSVTSIGDRAFVYCSNLASMAIPNSVTSIGVEAFNYCKNMTSITFSESVTRIGESSFGHCSGLTSITIPNSVVCIERLAFWYCESLISVTIPKSVKTIGNQAFDHCSELTSVTIESNTPIAISSYTFSNRANATLYVPAGCKAAYEAADYWKEFKEIVEITNFGDPTANTLALSDVSGYKGKQVELPIALNNQHEITGLQFDLYLPDGVTIATKSNGKLMINTTSRMEGNYSVTGNIMENGNFVRVVGYSADSDPFTGISGDILTITLNIGEYVADGDYPIYIRDIVLSDVNNTEYHPANAEGKLTVKSYTLGDVDNSGAVNINDVVCIINYILNRTNGVFIEEAADVDVSGTININDVVTLINRFILMRSNAPAQTGGLRAQQTVSITDNYLNLATIDIQPGETKEVELLMTNANTVAAIQGNIRLPKGLSFVTKSNGKVDVKNIDARSEDFTLSCAIQEDGSLTFAQYSADGFTYEGNSGGIFTFKVKADENAVVGDYDVNLTGVVLSIDGVGYDIPDRTSALKIIDVSGIDDAPLMDNGQLTKDSYYTLDGRKVEGAPTKKGVYIVNGNKVVMK